MGWHWKSKSHVGRFPLVHIALGANEQGVKETAVGIIAVGQRAIGFLSIGQFAYGVITIAQFGIGLLFGLGQFIAAPIGVAQFTLGLVAFGMFSLGILVAGGLTIGYMGAGEDGLHFIKYDWLQWIGMNTASLIAFMEEHIGVIVGVLFGLLFAFLILPMLLGAFIRWARAQVIDIKVRLGLVSLELVEATVVFARETGVYINHVPVIETKIDYTTKSGRRINATLRMRPGYLKLSDIHAGQRFTIAYDPAKPERPILPHADWNLASS